jgi:hypothetical protein
MKGKRDMKLNLHSSEGDHYDNTDRKPFPYVIERLFSGVYIKRSVVFTEMLPPNLDKRFFYIDEPEALARGKLKSMAREKLVDAVSHAARDTNHQMSAVFSPREAVYCDPDGSRRKSTDIPSGGVLYTEPVEN